MLLERIVQRYQSRSSITGTMIVPSCVHEGSPLPPARAWDVAVRTSTARRSATPGVHYPPLTCWRPDQGRTVAVHAMGCGEPAVARGLQASCCRHLPKRTHIGASEVVFVDRPPSR
jgi:hypothetical protein